MIIYVDLDEVLCHVPGDISQPRDYNQAVPDEYMIAKVNELSEQGHEIVIWTARGKLTKIDWKEITEKQLKDWEVKYDKLSFDKPYYDLLIDDKAVNLEYLKLDSGTSL